MFSLRGLRVRRTFKFLREYHHQNVRRAIEDYNYVPDEKVLSAQKENPNVYRLISAYRELGHLKSNTNPVVPTKTTALKQLDPISYGLEENMVIYPKYLLNMPEEEATVAEIVRFLEKTYCEHTSCDLSYLPPKKRDWIAKEIEAATNDVINNSIRIATSKLLLQSEAFDLYLATKFPTLKRYGLEGAESQLAFVAELLSNGGWTNAVIAMAHRGRLNLLTNLFSVAPSLIFHKIRGGQEMDVKWDMWTGDVLSHLICSNKEARSNTRVTILPNPSHLEVANPVSMGKTKSKQIRGDISKICNIQVHGDAAFAGQGINQEMLGFSRVVHFDVGGTVHLVVNNQLGFTTPGEYGRSSLYSSDLAKMVQAPVLYVNAEHPEEVMKAAKIAAKYRNEFLQDIFVEMLCYRRRGHNELDDPTVTNPQIYEEIRRRMTTPKMYMQKLVDEGVAEAAEISDDTKKYVSHLSAEFSKENVAPPKQHLEESWKDIVHPTKENTLWDTGVHKDTLRHIGLQSVNYPEDFDINQHLLKTHVRARKNAVQNGGPIDWSTAETMAFGSLLYQNHNVRLCGQDVGRGTFAHRHVSLVNQTDGSIYQPLNRAFEEKSGTLTVVNSILSEEAVMAFEYGYSIDHPDTLVLWEAQFGDFMNTAQTVIDTYLVGGQVKWARSSSMTLLLPHGYDGAGPEHSSCRVERFLQLSNSSETACDSDSVNISVAWPSTPAQYFHMLRRQQIRNFRTPLVVVTPKTLLRLPKATSKIADMEPGTTFQNVISEDNEKAKTVIFTSGRHFYTLNENRPQNEDFSIVRLESLVPFPARELQGVIAKQSKASNFIWSQEEPRNMGAWTFIAPRFKNLVGINISYKGCPELPVPAYGMSVLHKSSQQKTLVETFSL